MPAIRVAYEAGVSSSPKTYEEFVTKSLKTVKYRYW